MRGKSPLVIMELCIMLLVFAIAAALCLGCFALAEDISAESERRDRAVSMAQNCAESIKAADGDLAAAAEIMGGSWDGESLTLQQGELSLSAAETESGHELLGLAHIRVDFGGESIFAIDCPWQKGGGGNG